MVHHFTKLKKNHMIISAHAHAEKAFDKNTTYFMINKTRKFCIGGTFLNTIKKIYENPMASIILNGEKLEAFQ